MNRLRNLGSQFVGAASLKFERFAADLRRLESAVAAAGDDGRLDLDLAGQIWLDRDHALSLPLQVRYFAQGACDQVVEYHRKRTRIRTAGWPDPLARAALDGLLACGRSADAVALARLHLEYRLKALRKDIGLRRRRGPRRPLDAPSRAVIEVINNVIVDAIPDRKKELLTDIEAVEALISLHGDDQDRNWLAALRAEIWQERRA